MEEFNKIVRIGRTPAYEGGNQRDVFAKIKYEGGELLIRGVHGPLPSGNAYGSCGQIVIGDTLSPDRPWNYAPGWDREKLAAFRAHWDRWHLNHLKAGTPAQEAFLRENPQRGFLEAKAALGAAGLEPDNGYHYGSAWLKEDVPADVLAFLRALPDADKQPAWV